VTDIVRCVVEVWVVLSFPERHWKKKTHHRLIHSSMQIADQPMTMAAGAERFMIPAVMSGTAVNAEMVTIATAAQTTVTMTMSAIWTAAVRVTLPEPSDVTGIELMAVKDAIWRSPVAEFLRPTDVAETFPMV
jgi:hypothetical protein